MRGITGYRVEGNISGMEIGHEVGGGGHDMMDAA